VLYVIGGASRSGKSMAARRFMVEVGVPYFSLDFLMMGVARGLPELGVDPEEPSRDVSVKLWPLVQGMARNILEIGLDYLLEGDSVLPGQVHKLSIDFPGRVTSCFAGYPSVDPKAKLEEVRHNSEHLNDWLNDRSDEYILAFIKSMVEFSAELQDECERYAIPFFDVSQGFPEHLNAMVQYLIGSHSENTRQHIAIREHTG
jgi:hypothetical protein